MTGRPADSARTGTVVVVPCFNEEQRFDDLAFLDLVSAGHIRLVLVNDGSTDGTGLILEQLVHKSDAIEMLRLPRNMGKAEAVRRGMCCAIESGARIVGYFDADLATPTTELLRLVRTLESREDLMGVFGFAWHCWAARSSAALFGTTPAGYSPPSHRWRSVWPSTTRNVAPRCSE